MVMSKAHERGEQADTTLARMGVVTGVDLIDGLEKYRGAQETAGKIRSRIAAKEAEMVQLRARYEGFDSSIYNQQRKKRWAQLIEDERARARETGDGKAPSEARLEVFAYAHPQYGRILDDAEKDMLLLKQKQKELAEIQGELETALGVVAYFDKLCRANEAVIGFARGEMGLQR